MNNVIFESEEQAREVFGQIFLTSGTVIDNAIMISKEKGYIRKSIVEEAEEMYRKSIGYSSYGKTAFEVSGDLRMINNKLYEAIQYLKADNERLKK